MAWRAELTTLCSMSYERMPFEFVAFGFALQSYLVLETRKANQHTANSTRVPTPVAVPFVQ
jgi:hypothetical protein